MKENIHHKFMELEEHLLKDEKPSIYINKPENEGLFADVYPFTMLGALKNVTQSPVHHPEGNVWVHTLMVVDMAALGRNFSTAPRALMWAALLHDLGKAHTTKERKGKITAYDHDRHGARLAAAFLKEFTNDKNFITKVSRMVRWHMQALFVERQLPFANIPKMLSEVPLEEIALLSLCDRLGRGAMNEHNIRKETDKIRTFIQKCRQCLDGQKDTPLTPPPELWPIYHEAAIRYQAESNCLSPALQNIIKLIIYY
ncbi:MAG: HD domain-containing protein [Peptococcaceae bacterium]|jgi:tRNA nucleotidyltransferase (CCA-adding enzyme)|nr:HD domain-containing protein [Peptococcaceae bacterium]